MCCSSWGREELGTAEQLNNNRIVCVEYDVAADLRRA